MQPREPLAVSVVAPASGSGKHGKPRTGFAHGVYFTTKRNAGRRTADSKVRACAVAPERCKPSFAVPLTVGWTGVCGPA